MNQRNALLFFVILALIGGGIVLIIVAGSLGQSKKVATANVPTTGKPFPIFGNFFGTPATNTSPVGNQNGGNTSAPTQTSTTQTSKPPAKPSTTAEVVAKPILNTQNPILETTDSPLKGKIKFGYSNNVRSYNYDKYGNVIKDPQQEYLSIQALKTNTEKIRITGLKLMSLVTNQSATIGQGSYLPYPGAVNATQDIYLDPGETATIISGHSPIGDSFQVNQCTGYFSQHQTFYPNLPTECPVIRNEPLPPPPNNINDKCLDTINSFGSCRTFDQGQLAQTPECNSYLVKVTTYNYCVSTHKNDTGFFKPDWRVYLSRSTALWREKRETIELVDQNGKVIDTYTY